MNTPPLLSLPLKAGSSSASGAVAGEREPSAAIKALLDEATLATLAEWRPFPFYFLGATASGAPVPTSTWLKAAFSAESLHFLFLSEEPLHSGEGIAVLIDPVGDLEAYYEIGLSSAGFLQSAIVRRSRSGHKRDARWVCEGAHAAYQAGEGGLWSALFSIPCLSLADRVPRLGESWLINAQRSHLQDGAPIQSTLERLPRFRQAVFP